MILPYDWFLPGKEQRRKRKHRKSHGAISFNDLSSLVATAWKAVDDEVKLYCTQVCVAGKLTYKAAVQEWRRRAAPRLQVSSKDMSHESQMQHAAMKITVQKSLMNAYNPVRTNRAHNLSPQTCHIQDMAANKAQPNLTPLIFQDVVMSDMNEGFENALTAVGNEKIARMWKTQQPPACPIQSGLNPVGASGAVLSKSRALPRVSCGDDFETSVTHHQNQQAFRTSLVSNEVVDIEDSDIMSMWNEEPATAAAVNSDLHHHAMFGVKGFDQTMRDIQALRTKLEEQLLRLKSISSHVS